MLGMIAMFTKKSHAAIKLMGRALIDKPENVDVKYKKMQLDVGNEPYLP